MKKKDISKPKLQPLMKKNRVLKPIKNTSNNNSKKNEQKIPKSKISKKKVRIRSMSAVAKEEPKIEQIKLNNSLNNSLELDYLNFTQIDLFKLNQSFEGDIFTPNYNSNNQNNRDKIILNRYEDSISTINDNSSITNTNNLENENLEKLKNKDFLIDTPSTICNYYEQSSNKDKVSNKGKYFNDTIPNEGIKKNLQYYYNMNNINDIKNIDKSFIDFGKRKNEVKENNDFKENNINMMNAALFNDNLINYKKAKKEETNNKNIMNFYSNYSKNRNSNKNKKNKTNDNIKTIDYKQLDNKFNVNILLNEKCKGRKGSQEKQINIYNNQNKNETYFITPRNINKTKNVNSTKSTKINTKSIGKAKSFSSKKVNKTKYINNKLIYLNKK
jgi:hypothetical protein